MSHDTTSTENHGFHPHILPLKVYILVGLSLFTLTGITVAVAQVHLGSAGNLIVALAVATVKAILVALFFMHLLYDNKLYLVVFLASLLFLSIFITITLFDTQRRGDIDPNRAVQREHPMIEGLAKAEAAEGAAHEAEAKKAEPQADSVAPSATAEQATSSAPATETKEETPATEPETAPAH